MKTKDIDLIEIAKNNNFEELTKLFELVMAVMTESPNKEDHINTIMSLDERSQAAFVDIIQNILENRVIDRSEPKHDKIYDMLHQFQTENGLLKHEIDSLLNYNFQLEKEIDDNKAARKDCEEELDELRGEKVDRQIPNEEYKEKEHLKHMVENLKEKLISTVREHELKISAMKEDANILENKLMRYEDI